MIRSPVRFALSCLLIGLFLVGITACHPSSDELSAIDYAPYLLDDGLAVSTPEAEGVDPRLVSYLYYEAGNLETLYGLLVIKNGALIAEDYFNGAGVDQQAGRQSVTKSVTSALVGLALDQWYLTSVEQTMMGFFPELEGRFSDPRKSEITIRDLLQMRAGYPNEERLREYLDILFFSNDWHWIPHLADFPLVSDPGDAFHYSNLTSHALGMIVARAVGTDLKTFAQEHLFGPMGAQIGQWTRDGDGYNFGALEIHLTARDMAKLGMLYLDRGAYAGSQIMPADWVDASLRRYSEGINVSGWLTSRYGSFRDLGYGYQWWSAKVGDHAFSYACGHGANYIILLHDLDMILVTTADPLYGPDLAAGGGWPYEKEINELVGSFIKALP